MSPGVLIIIVGYILYGAMIAVIFAPWNWRNLAISRRAYVAVMMTLLWPAVIASEIRREYRLNWRR